MVGDAYTGQSHSGRSRSHERALGHVDHCGSAASPPPTRLHATEASISSRFVRAVQTARRRRDAIIGVDMFSDPAWDVLLELYALHLEQRRVSVSGLCEAAQVPVTTGCRWMTKFDRDGLTIRHGDPNDNRRLWVELSRDGVERMKRYFELLPFGSLAG